MLGRLGRIVVILIVFVNDGQARHHPQKFYTQEYVLWLVIYCTQICDGCNTLM
jgi:hypothetical protein